MRFYLVAYMIFATIHEEITWGFHTFALAALVFGGSVYFTSGVWYLRMRHRDTIIKKLIAATNLHIDDLNPEKKQ